MSYTAVTVNVFPPELQITLHSFKSPGDIQSVSMIKGEQNKADFKSLSLQIVLSGKATLCLPDVWNE